MLNCEETWKLGRSSGKKCQEIEYHGQLLNMEIVR